MTEDSMENELAVVENRLRSDLPALAEALLSVDEESEMNGIRNEAAADRQRALPRYLQLAAAAVGVLLIGAGALWLSDDSPDQIEAALDQASVDDEALDTVDELTRSAEGLEGWASLSASDTRTRAHAVSVWTGTEALFWGGRIDVGGAESDTVEAIVGGASYNPVSDSWSEIEAPEWGHPGTDGVYHDGWVYVLAKQQVTRFNPVDGSEQDIEVPAKFGGGATTLFVLRDRVWVIGVLNRGPVAVPIDAASGLVVEEDLISVEPWLIESAQLGDMGDRLAVYDDDLYLAASGSIFRVDGETGESTTLVDPSGVPEPGDLRVFAGDAHVIFVSVDGTTAVNIGTLDERGGVEWAEETIEVDNVADATIVAAGDWLTVLPNGEVPISFHVVEGLYLPHNDSPLAGYANANAVWTGQELVVWGGQGQPAVDGGADGARWVPPFVPGEEEATEGPVDEESEEPAAVDALPGNMPDALPGSMAEVEAAIQALPLDKRIDLDAIERGEIDFSWTPDGVWVYSRPQVEPSSPLHGHGEILLLAGFEGPILESWFMPLSPAGTMAVGPDGVACLRTGDGALPDTIVCHIDPVTGQMTARVWPAESIDGAYTERGWTVEEPWQVSTQGAPPVWSSAAMSDQGVIVGGLGRWTLLSAEDLSTIEAIETETDDVVTACPLLASDRALTEQPDLPQAVAATRQAVFEAAMNCDFDRLIELGVNTNTSFGGGTFAENLDLSPDGGGGDLVFLVALLNLPFAADELDDGGQSEVRYSWPSAFIDDSEDGSGIPPDELTALTELYGPTFLADLQSFGGYYQHRVGIEADGTWSFFIAGD